MSITDAAGYMHELETINPAEPQKISQLLDSLANAEHVSGDLAALEFALERIVADRKYQDELRIARAVKNIKRIRRVNAAHLSRQISHTYRRGPDLCGND